MTLKMDRRTNTEPISADRDIIKFDICCANIESDRRRQGNDPFGRPNGSA